MEIIADILGQNKKWVKRDKISRSYGLEIFFFLCVCKGHRKLINCCMMPLGEKVQVHVMVFPFRKWSMGKKKGQSFVLTALLSHWEVLYPLPAATAVGLLAATEQQQLGSSAVAQAVSMGTVPKDLLQGGDAPGWPVCFLATCSIWEKLWGWWMESIK